MTDDLISRQAAIDAFDNQTWERLDIPICKEIRNAAKETIRQLPTIDAVPVIRCKDCKWNDGGEWVDCYMSGMHGRTSNNNFCSRAERKEE